MEKITGLLVLLAAFLAMGSIAQEQPSGGVILVYHHVSEDTPVATSISPDQFAQHLDYLEENHFNPIGIERMLSAINQGEALPEKAIAISFDDAYESVYSTAFPLLKERDWPFSVFVSTEAIDSAFTGYMSWQQLQELSDYGAEIGGHTQTHAHLVRKLEGESQIAWRNRVSQEIDVANQRIEERLDTKVRLFAYPYGEFNGALKEILANRNLFGLAQHSGAVGVLSDFLALPRYPMAQSFAAIDRFALVANTKALPVTEIDAGPLIRRLGEGISEFHFSVLPGDFQLNNIACYSATGELLEHKENEGRISVVLPSFSVGRNKVNCTAPSSILSGQYYWFSQLWMVQTEQGEWPDE